MRGEFWLVFSTESSTDNLGTAHRDHGHCPSFLSALSRCIRFLDSIFCVEHELTFACMSEVRRKCESLLQIGTAYVLLLLNIVNQ